MAEDLAENLKNYRLQLQQVEAALTSEPDNEELLKLKNDLDEVINLTTELVQGENESSSGKGSHKKPFSWSVGQKCMAEHSGDRQYYEAVINSIDESGQCTVTFNDYQQSDVIDVSKLKKIDNRATSVFSEAGSSKAKKQAVQEQREQKKKKQLKKVQRVKQLEEEREVEKNKWKQFNAKAFTKNKRGHVKKSIFATPDAVNGRVGVGTCGIGGRPMTDFQHSEKYKKSLH